MREGGFFGGEGEGVNLLVSCASSTSLDKISVREPVDHHLGVKKHVLDLTFFHVRLLLEGSGQVQFLVVVLLLLLGATAVIRG